jgi:hypothetical protein
LIDWRASGRLGLGLIDVQKNASQLKMSITTCRTYAKRNIRIIFICTLTADLGSDTGRHPVFTSSSTSSISSWAISTPRPTMISSRSNEFETSAAQGKISVGTCGYGNCEAFCTQVPFTDKCETVRWDASSSPVVGMSPCTKHAMTYKDTSGNVNGCAYVGGIHFIDHQFSRCPSPNANACPYNSEEKYQCGQCSSSKPATIEPNSPRPPDQCCPTAVNRGSEGYPSFFTDPRVPLDASITCEAACACNKKHGYGHPDCYDPGEPYPGPLSYCYCDGHNIAYDKAKFDQCGYYLPIFGEGVLPSQYESYKDYAKENGLDNAYPAPITKMCKPIGDVITPPSHPLDHPPGGTNVQTRDREERVLPGVAHAKNLNQAHHSACVQITRL